jgi:sterol desaturase/sphingolipid hydroxylase (fatty acid hydroxylase superfamily)
VAVKPRVSGAGAAGAVTLNFVLSIVFGGVVTIMAFAMGGDAFGMLGTETYKGLDANWVFNLLLPAYAMIVLVTFGVYTTIVARHGEGKKAA